MVTLLDEEIMERMTGIEPASGAWKAPVLPLNYIRNDEPETSAADYTTSSRGCKRWVQERPFEPGGQEEGAQGNVGRIICNAIRQGRTPSTPP